MQYRSANAAWLRPEFATISRTLLKISWNFFQKIIPKRLISWG
nr:MAG TPA: hypothetical protein [Caudoviricetes sp.]